MHLSSAESLAQDEPLLDRYDYSASAALGAGMAHHPLSKLYEGLGTGQGDFVPS